MKFEASYFLPGVYWQGWRRWGVWLVCITVLLLLGVLRIATDAELAFASLALFPVFVIAWIEGKKKGLFVAILAAAVWLVSDMVTEREFSAPWVPWVNVATRLFTYSLVALLAAQVRLLLEREYARATRDVLTGLRNRRNFLNVGASEVDRSKRYAHPLTVIFLDLDNFKQLNDTKGHDAGDAALQATAKALVGALRTSDRIARLGGDEFAILLPEVGYDAAVGAGRKISDALNKALRDFPPVSGSIGVAWFGEVDRTFPAMLKMADDLMYEVKESGKGDMLSRRFAPVNKPIL